MNSLQINNEITLITCDMNVYIIGGQENNMLSESASISFINVNFKLPKGFNHSCLDHICVHSNENIANKIKLMLV
jgi:hypothetical protein